MLEYIRYMFKLGSKQLRKTKPTPETFETIKRNPIYLVLDRIIDTYNIGSLFRLADAIAVEKIYLCGDMEYPPSSKIHKSAVGTEEWVPWEKVEKAVEIVKKLKKDGVHILAVEQDKRAINYKDLKPVFPIAIVIGHETDGVSKEILALADTIVEFPMYGVNKSFNVWGSAAIAAYKVLESLVN
jgi:tRNA G18 (ribose-2'-O)-methylase SpoU